MARCAEEALKLPPRSCEVFDSSSGDTQQQPNSHQCGFHVQMRAWLMVRVPPHLSMFVACLHMNRRAKAASRRA